MLQLAATELLQTSYDYARYNWLQQQPAHCRCFISAKLFVHNRRAVLQLLMLLEPSVPSKITAACYSHTSQSQLQATEQTEQLRSPRRTGPTARTLTEAQFDFHNTVPPSALAGAPSELLVAIWNEVQRLGRRAEAESAKRVQVSSNYIHQLHSS
jgi:hypothetical protein